MKDLCSALSGWIFFVAFVPYIIAILRGQTRPRKSTWLIWASLDSIVLYGMVKQQTLNGQIIGAVSGAWIVTFLAFRFGQGGWSKTDKLCVTGATIGLAAMLVNPAAGLALSVAVVFLGSIPTFQAAWSHPEQEDKLAWTLYFVSCLFALAALPSRPGFDAWAQPVAFTAVESTMMYLLYFHGRKR